MGWKETEATNNADSSLSGFRLLLAMHVWHKRNMNLRKVVPSNAPLELAQSFDERRGLNITNSSAELRTNVNE